MSRGFTQARQQMLTANSVRVDIAKLQQKEESRVSFDPSPFIAALDALGPSLSAVLAEYLYDTLSHARLAMLKYHRMPRYRAAQKMLATRIYRYTTGAKEIKRLPDLRAELFVTARTYTGEDPWGDFLLNLENGGTVRSAKPMAIPMPGRDPHEFRRLIKEGKLSLTKSGYLVQSTWDSDTSELWGKLTRSRMQPKQIGFRDQFTRVWIEKRPALARIAQIATTESGREMLLLMATAKRATGMSYAIAYKRALEDGKSNREAAKVAKRAQAATRRMLGRTGRMRA